VETYCDLSANSCVVGCTSDTQCSAGRICDAASRTCHDGCRSDSQCSTGQICATTNQCVTGCRSDGQCAGGHICDSNDQCVTGCRTDSQCATGSICDNLVCRAGCRADSQCASGSICQPSMLTCSVGCRIDSQCPREQLCNVTALMCQPGCHLDTDCNAGHICSGGLCRAGCRQNTDCALGSYCDNGADAGFICKLGCGRPTSGMQGGDLTRCSVGQACVSIGLPDGGPADGGYRHECSKTCEGWPCATSPGQMYTCFVMGLGGASFDYDHSACRLPCQLFAATTCPVGQVCNAFTSSAINPPLHQVFFCSNKCASDADCVQAIDPTDSTNSCHCSPDGLCRKSASTAICVQLKPTALLP
jgi:hypothetical protein